MNTKASRASNGVNVDALLAAREALTAAPEAAKFRWRATCDWVNGTHSRSNVDGIASVAQNRNIQLRSVQATLEGAMDLAGILGIDGDVRNGFDGVTVRFKIDADASREDIEALVAQSQKRSAVFDIVTNPTNVAVEVV
jgi:hypothetical protein